MKQRLRGISRSRSSIAAIATAALIVSMSACGSSGGSASDTADGGTQQEATITVGLQLGTLATYSAELAQRLGYYKQENLNVKLITANSTANGVSGIVGGSIDFYFGGPEALIANAKDNAGLVLIASTGNTSSFNIVSAPQYNTVASLKGQTFAVSSKTSISTVASQGAFVAQGLPLDAVKQVVIGSTSARWAALKAGKVAATSLGEPLIPQARGQGFNILGYTDVDLGGPTLLTGAIAAKASWVKTHADVTKRFLTAIMKVVGAYYDPKMLDTLAPLVAKGISIPLELAKAAIPDTFSDKTLQQSPKDMHIDMTALLNSAKAEQSVGAIPKDADLEALVKSSVDGSYAAAVAKSLGIPASS
jgi:ABC-type nitrate/sulfonate/bicarbonate transport systems, periplasmic components